MNASFSTIKTTITNKLIPGGSQSLELSDSTLGLDGLSKFLAKFINQPKQPQLTLTLRQATLETPGQTNKVVVKGKADILGETGLNITFTIAAALGQGPLVVSFQCPWKSGKTLPFAFSGAKKSGNYSLEQMQLEITWMGNDEQDNPQFYSIISGNMKLSNKLAAVPMQIRFPAAPNTVFIQSALPAPYPLPDLRELADIAQVPELASWLPASIAKAKGLALDQVGIMYNNKARKVSFFSISVSADGWELVPNAFAIEDLRFSIMASFAGKTTALTAELDADLVIKTFRLPLFIRIAPNKISFGKASTERFLGPSIEDLMEAIGGDEIKKSLPDGFSLDARISIDMLEVDIDIDSNTKAKKLNSLYFAISIASMQLGDNFELKYLGLGFRLDRQGGTSNISGNFMCVLLLGTKNKIELDVSANLTTSSSGAKSWEFDSRAKNINVGDLVDTIAETFDTELSLPQQLHELVIAELGLSFSKAAQGQNAPSEDKFTFTCEIKYGKDVDVSLTIVLSKTTPGTTNTGVVQPQVQQPKKKGGYYLTVTGIAKVSGEAFELDLNVKNDASTNTTSGLLAFKTKNVSIDLGKLAGSLIDDPSVQSLIPSVAVTPNYALVARLNKTTPTPPYPKSLIGLDLDLKVDLKGLPLVGKLLGDADFEVKDIQFLYANTNLDVVDVQAVNSLNPPATLPDQLLNGISTDPAAGGSPAAPPNTAIVLAKGLGFKATVLLGSFAPWQINLPARPGSTPAKGKQAAQPQASTSNTGSTGAANSGESGDASPQGGSGGGTAPPPGGDATWIDLQQAVGPVQFNRIGFKYKNKMIWGYLDASLTLAGLTLSLDGLGVGNPINKFDPTFSLNGLGLDFSEGPVEIGGSFLRDSSGPYDEYDGMAVIKAEIFNLSAIGSYAKVNGQDSLFIYAVLNYPLGGPSFFFVTGLAAGFGYNRAIRVPPITGVATFPLVNEAVNGAGSGPANDPQSRRKYLQKELTSLRTAIYPKPKEYFLAAGIRYTSFEMLDSFAMVSVSFGQHFEVDVLGLSTLAIPTPEDTQTVPPIAEAQLALRAVLNPDKGVLSIEAQLTSNSYLFARACHLTGGFAFYAWFGGPHAGDFVITLGGYHPRFVPPAYYPKVPRLGFNWQVSDKFSIKGGLYFALTAHALMAGGNLQALFHLGPIKAWFIVGADFIVSWQPYFYDAHMYVNIGASFTFWAFGTRTITFQLGADLHVWGPDFSGKATIHYYIVSFTISFGKGPGKPKPLKWEAFKSSFLPDDSKIVTANVTNGLIKEETLGNSEGKRYILDPKNATLTINSQVPVKTYDLGLNNTGNKNDQLYFVDSGHQILLPLSDKTKAQNNTPTTDFGLAPMDVAKVDSSSLSVTIKRDGEDANGDFAFTPVLKRMPRAMWGDKLEAEVNDQQFIENALAGFEIRPAKPPTPGQSRWVLKKNLQFEVDKQPGAFDCPSVASYKGAAPTATGELNKLNTLDSKRNGLLQGLGLDTSNLAPPKDLDQLVVEKPLSATFA
jgi:hypothetical protein